MLTTIAAIPIFQHPILRHPVFQHPVFQQPFPRDPAQEEAKRELSKQIYTQQESLLSKVYDAIMRWIMEQLDSVTGGTGQGTAAIAVIALVVIALVVAVLLKYGPLARTRRRAEGPAGNVAPTASGSEHRRLAAEHAAAGRFAEAIREELRAIVRDLTDRGVLDNRLGWTALEVAEQAGRKLPAAAAGLREAANLFGAVWYGRQPATAQAYERIRAIGESVAAARPGPAAGEPVAAGSWALPADANREAP
ncbi:MAG: hypothetical protein JWO79_3935 [Actinomycetia bacterium]|nr:hypothetical protein [Actinomycetes bacterium]